MRLMKRFVVTMGDSRVGKSTIARLLLDLYRKREIQAWAFYHGHRNKISMYQHFNIVQLGFSRGDSDQLLTDLELNTEVDVVLTDMPGQNFRDFREFEQDVSLLKNLQSLDYRITFVHPISYRKDCITDYLQETISYFGNSVDYIVVKNYYFGKEFSCYDDSETKLHIDSLDGVEVVLEQLNKSIYTMVEDAEVSYSSAIETSSAINLLQKSIIFYWMTNFHSLLINNIVAADYLGLSNKLALFNEIDSKI